MPEYPQEGSAARRPHPGCEERPVGARRQPEDGTFKSAAGAAGDLRTSEQGLTADDDVIAYCRIGERRSHTWFVLTYLLGLPAGAQLRRQLDRVGQWGWPAD